MIASIAAAGVVTPTTRATSTQADGEDFASTLSAVSQTNSTQAATAGTSTAAPSSVLGSPGWFNILFASPQEERTFASDLTQRLQAAGVDTSRPIALTVDAQGHVKAKDGTPGKAAIDALFACDPALENSYKKIANTEETTTLAREYTAYASAYGAAQNNAARGAVWQQYSGAFAEIAAGGADLTLVNGSLETAKASA